jgi:RimK family alpha-L-glutamate ligase
MMPSVNGITTAADVAARKAFNVAIIANEPTPQWGGGMIKQVLESRGHHVEWIPRKEVTFGSAGEIYRAGQLVQRPDAIILRTGARLQQDALDAVKQLADSGMPVVPHPSTIEVARSKAQVAEILTANNVPHPQTVVLNRAPAAADSSSVQMDQIKAAVDAFGEGTPVVVKPSSDMGGRGVLFLEAGSQQSIGSSAEALFDLGGYDTLVAQRWIKESGGRDIRAYFVRNPDGKVEVAPMGLGRFGGEGRAKANVSSGGSIGPVELTPDQRETATRVADIMKMDVGSVDFLPAAGRSPVVEVNSAPGLLPEIVDVIGMPAHERIADLVEARIRTRHA